MKIMTVLGPIASEDLGFTTMHEHVMMDGGWVLRTRYKDEIKSQNEHYSENDPLSLANIGLIKRNFMTNWDALSLDDENMMLGEVQDYKKSGGKAILEVGVPGIRYKIPSIKKISEAAGIHIIISTGLYTFDSWPEKYISMNEEEIKKYMLEEIKYGVDDTGIMPGHIKIAVHDLNIHEEMALRAAAKAANETGLSMTIHCGSTIGGDGRRVARILREEEMDISRAIIAHAAGKFMSSDQRLLALHPENIRLNLDYCKELMDFGINVSLEVSPGNLSSEDRNEVSKPDWVVLAGIIALIKQGYTDQIVLGTDTCGKIMTRRGGGEGYCRLTCFAIPKLKEFGISDYDIRMMTERNPARLLAF